MAHAYDFVLVGGGGLIGTQLGEALRAAGKTVFCISRERPSYDPEGMHSWTGDLMQELPSEGFIPPCETLVLLIGQNGVDFDREKELQLLEALAKRINAADLKKVCFFSSVLVYGNRTAPATETDEPRPVEEYSRYKVAAEKLLQRQLRPEIVLVILRLANVYGHPKNRGFINWVMLQACSGDPQPLQINGDGLQARDYVFIDDLVEILIKLFAKVGESDCINIATGTSYTLLDVVSLASKISGKELPYRVLHNDVHEASKSLISSEKLNERYGIVARHSFPEGLEMTYARYRAALDA